MRWETKKPPWEKGLKLLSCSLFWVDIPWEYPFYSAHWPLFWLTRLLYHWSGGQTISLTLLLRLLASTELRLYLTNLPCLIFLRTIRSEWTRPRWSPFGLMLNVTWVHSRNLWSPGNSRDIIIAIMELDWSCTGVLGMRKQSCLGILWFFKRPWVSPLEKQRKRHHDIWCLITNTWANGVAIISSAITKIFNPCKYWRSRFNLLLNTQWFSVVIQLFVYIFSESVLVLFVASFYCSSVV